MTQTIDQLTEQATSRLAADPQAARRFDQAAQCNASNRQAVVYATLQAAKAKMAENVALQLKRDAAKRRIAALQVATALASKPTSSRPAAPAPRPSAAAQSRPDKRQGDLPLSQWALEHLFRLGITGDAGALDEIKRRGFTVGKHGMSRSMKA